MKIDKKLIGEMVVTMADETLVSNPNSCRTPNGDIDRFLPMIKKGYKLSNYKSTWIKGWVSVPIPSPQPQIEEYKYIHMPREIAEKAMVFEFLPDLGV
jgi:hypothetical protein